MHAKKKEFVRTERTEIHTRPKENLFYVVVVFHFSNDFFYSFIQQEKITYRNICVRARLANDLQKDFPLALIAPYKSNGMP